MVVCANACAVGRVSRLAPLVGLESALHARMLRTLRSVQRGVTSQPFRSTRARRYNSLKLLLKSAPLASASRDDALHIRAAINRRLTPPHDDVCMVRCLSGQTAAAVCAGSDGSC
jgi:hypothetical protein